MKTRTPLFLLLALAWSAAAHAAEPGAAPGDANAPEAPAQVPAAEAPAKPAPPPVAVATVPAAAPSPSPKAEAPVARAETVTVEFGSRTLYVRDDAYGIFSNRRALEIGGLALRVPVYRDDAWTYAAGVSFDGKDGVGGTARSVPVAFDLLRVVARGEVSYDFLRYGTAYGGVGLGAESLDFRYGGATESAWAKTWSPTGELSLGVGAHGNIGWLRLGARLDGGYAVAKSHALRVALPEVGDVVRQPVDLGTLSTSAPFVRFALHVGF